VHIIILTCWSMRDSPSAQTFLNSKWLRSWASETYSLSLDVSTHWVCAGSLQCWALNVHAMAANSDPKENFRSIVLMLSFLLRFHFQPPEICTLVHAHWLLRQGSYTVWHFKFQDLPMSNSGTYSMNSWTLNMWQHTHIFNESSAAVDGHWNNTNTVSQ